MGWVGVLHFDTVADCRCFALSNLVHCSYFVSDDVTREQVEVGFGKLLHCENAVTL